MKLNEWLRIFILLALIAFCTIILSNIFVRKNDLHTWNSFYDLEEDSVDIVVIGSSILGCTIDPYMLSKETGCTVYNIAIPAEASSVHAAQIREIIKTQHPKLIIVETFRYMGVGRMDVDAATHCINGMKPSFNKLYLQAGLPLHEGKFYRLELMIPLLAHHARWEDLSSDDFRSTDSFVNSLAWWGDGYKTAVYPVPDFTPKTDEIGSMDILLRNNLVNVINVAKENDVTILFINPPNSEYTEENYKTFNAMYQYLDDMGVDYIECDYDEDFLNTIDINKDFADYHHLNIYGARKTTMYLANYINEHYSFDGQFSEDMPEYQYYLKYMDEHFSEYIN